jgi:hypothetical protein
MDFSNADIGAEKSSNAPYVVFEVQRSSLAVGRVRIRLAVVDISNSKSITC